MRALELAGFALFSILVAMAAGAATVTGMGDSGAGSLRQAIADAKAGDTIEVKATGTITLTSGELAIDKNLTIAGPGAGSLAVSGNHKSRVFNVSGGTVTISGLTIKDGQATGSPARGGGVYNNGTLTLRNVTVKGNEAEGAAGQSAYGAGIYSNSTMTVANCVITGNTAKGGDGTAGGNGARGGGICTVGALTLTQSLISDNTAAGGSSSGAGRAGDGEGGGIFFYNNCAVKVEGVTVSGNTARGGKATGDSGIGGYASGGGMIQNWGGGGGTRTFTNCTISGNKTEGTTGGMADSVSRGGGVWETSSGTLVNCTVTGNKTLGRFQEGGGLYSATTAGEGPAIKNCILFGNTATSGPDLRGRVRSQDCNLIGSAKDSTLTGESGKNIVGQDPKLGPLAENGGPTPTHALMASSPAIDKVPPEACPVQTDQRGVKRPQGAACDMGAFEADVVPPNAKAIKATTPSQTNGKTVGFAVNFDEDVRNFAAESDLIITQTGKVSHAGVTIGGGPRDYTVQIAGVKGDGSIMIAVNTKAKVQDMAGNALASSVTSPAVVIDNTPPAAETIVPVTKSPTNAKAVQFTVSFSEPVQGLNAEADLVITQTGSVAHTGVAFAGGPKSYTVDVNGVTGEGTITLAVNAKSDVRDLAGNPLASSVTSPAVTLDNTAPTATVALATPSPTRAASPAFNVVFSEPVAPTFAPPAVALTGTLAAAATVQIGGTDPNYTATVTPTDVNASGTVGMTVGAGVTDPAGNPLAAPVASPLVTIDHAPPTLTVTPVTPSPTHADALVFNAVFSEPVTPTFKPDSIALTGTLAAAATAQIGGTDPAYTVTLTPKDPNANGTLGFAVGAGVTDAAGNPLTPSVTSPLITLDNTPPTVAIAPTTPSPTRADALAFSATFSKPVAPTFVPGCIALTGTLAADATAQIGGADPAYTVTVTPKDPNANGTLGFSIGSAATDPAGNALSGNAASPLITIDNAAPNVAITAVTPSPTQAAAVVFNVVFTKPVAPTFVAGAVTLAGTLAGAAAVQIGGTDPAYTVTVTPNDPKASGTVGITVGVSVTDPAGNPLPAAATGPLITINHQPPTVTLTPAAPGPAHTPAVVFNAVFSAPVTPSFTMETVALTGTLATAAAAQIGGTDPAYTVTATANDPKAEGTLGVVVKPGVKDVTGLALAAAVTSPLVTIDHTPPTVKIEAAPPGPTHAPAATFNVTFSEPVAPSFAPEKIALTGTLAAAATAQIGGTDPAFNVSVTPKDPAANGTVGITVGTGVTDVAGNPLAAAVTGPLVTFDHAAPTATITLTTTNLAGAPTLAYTVEFSEPVAPTFTPERIALAGSLAKAATFAISGADPAYTVTITPADPNAHGTIGFSIGSGVTDPAGNAFAGAASGLCTK